MEINGIKVQDAIKPVQLQISQQDTKLGATKDPGACAAARCAVREVPGCKAARIHLGRSYLRINDKWLRFKTPQALRSEIVAFDRGGTFEAGVYTLTPLPPSMTETGRRRAHNKKQAAKRSETNRNTGKLRNKLKKLRVRHVTTGVRQHGANR